MERPAQSADVRVGLVPDAPVDAAWPDTQDRPVVVVIDASSALERRLLESWVARLRPEGGAVSIVAIPSSRRRRFGRRTVSTELREAVETGGDPLLQPLRVAWLAAERKRPPRLLNLLTFGDVRDPNRLLQEWIVRFRPERVRIIAGEPAPASDLKRRWAEARARSPEDPFDLAEFVALQASLALERADRQLRGNRYKVPRFLAEDLFSRGSVRMGLLRLAEQTGEPIHTLTRRSARYLKEIAATHSTYVIDVVAALIRVLYTQAYHDRILYDKAELDSLAELGQHHSLVFLPSHKSNLDHLVLTYVLYENGLPPNHTAGGINMNFFPIGPIIRRAGVFFIRRSFKDNLPYKFVLKQYLDYLLAKRFPLEWFIEGGRSRSGKLRAPRYGMLAYVSDSYRRGACDDAVLIPVSIAYDQIQDVGSYASEQRGGAKERESFSWMVRAIKTLRRRHGRIALRFGEPISLAATFPQSAGPAEDPDEQSLDIRKLAFEVAVRINRVTPVTPISLVTLALLGARGTALTVGETIDWLGSFRTFVEERDLPVIDDLQLDEADHVRSALDALVDHGVVSRFDGGNETVYSIGSEQHLAAAYYRNTIIHFFTTGAIAELGLVAASEADTGRLEVFWDNVLELRDLLKFEFFFSGRDDFVVEVTEEIARHSADWEQMVEGSGEGALDVLRSFRPYTAHWALRPFLEAYLVTADVLAIRDYRAKADSKALVSEALALGKQYLLQRRIASPESVSTVLFETAVSLADNQDLLEGEGPDLLDRRVAFASRLAAIARRIDTIEALAQARRVGLE
ncbi:glycerol-3-phosphate 1-O-acyltransferase [bacterium]|nr:glycerol-3-phosphate 1-O-acyltransferase [bacterium]